MEGIPTKPIRPRQAVSRKKATKALVKPTSAAYLRRYALRLDQFHVAEITYQFHLFVRKIAKTLPPHRRATALLPLLYGTAKAFQLNELELAVWSLYLTRVVWQQPADQLEKLLGFAAFAAKEFFDAEPEIYSAYLSSRIPDFSVSYPNWRTSCHTELEVSPTELRDRFQALSDTPIEIVHEEARDYNQMILTILELSPPLQPSQFEEDLAKHMPTPPVLSLQEDHKLGATTSSCSPVCSEEEEEGEAGFWDVNSPSQCIGSLSEIWPELSPRKKPSDMSN